MFARPKRTEDKALIAREVQYRVLVYEGSFVTSVEERTTNIVWEGTDLSELSFCFRRGSNIDPLQNEYGGFKSTWTRQYTFEYQTVGGEWIECADPRLYVLTPDEMHCRTRQHQTAVHFWKVWVTALSVLLLASVGVVGFLTFLSW